LFKDRNVWSLSHLFKLLNDDLAGEVGILIKQCLDFLKCNKLPRRDPKRTLDGFHFETKSRLLSYSEHTENGGLLDALKN